MIRQYRQRDLNPYKNMLALTFSVKKKHKHETFFIYLKENDHMEKGWIRTIILDNMRGDQSTKCLNKNERIIIYEPDGNLVSW